MKFRFAGVMAALTLLVISAVPVSAEAEISVGDRGILSNGRQTVTIDVDFTCEHPDSIIYIVKVRIVQPSGRTLADGARSIQGPCETNEDVTVSVLVDTSTSPFKPGPATMTVDLERVWAGYDSDHTHLATTVKLKAT